MKKIVWARIGSNSAKKLSQLAETKEISISEYIRQLILDELAKQEVEF